MSHITTTIFADELNIKIDVNHRFTLVSQYVEVLKYDSKN